MDYKEYIIKNHLKLEYRSEKDFYDNLPKLKEKIINDFKSGDISRIFDAARIISGCCNLNLDNEVEEFKKIYKSLPENKVSIMRDYRIDVGYAISILEHFKCGYRCKCGIYSILSEPKREVSMGFLQQLSPEIIHLEKYETEFNFKCNYCNSKWKCFEVLGYHYPWYRWEKV